MGCAGLTEYLEGRSEEALQYKLGLKNVPDLSGQEKIRLKRNDSFNEINRCFEDKRLAVEAGRPFFIKFIRRQGILLIEAA